MGENNKTYQPHILIFTKKSKQISKALNEQDYSITVAKDTASTITLCQKQQPDLLLLDDIPTCKQLSINHQANILFVGLASQIDEALEAGAIDCYTETIHPRILHKRIVNLLSNNSQIDSPSLQCYRSVFEAANDGILLIDAESSKIMDANPKASKMLGYSIHELKTLSIEELEQIIVTDKPPITKLPSTPHLTKESFYKRCDGSLISLEASSRLMTFDGQPTIVSFLRDITERKEVYEAERKQRILADTLRQNLAKLSSTLDLNEVFTHLLSAIQPLVPYHGANIMLIEDNKLSVDHSIGYKVPHIGRNFDISELPDFVTMLETKQPFYIPDTSKFEGWKDVDNFDWIKSNVSVPIMIDATIIGFLNLDSSKKDGFTEEQIQWLVTFANQAGIAIRNAHYTTRLEERIQERTQKLESETAQLQTILNAMRDGVIYTNMDREIQYINKSLHDLTGYAEDEWLKNIAGEKIRLQTPEELAEIRVQIEESLNKKGYWRGQTPLKHKDGTLFTGELTRTLVKNNAGKPIGMLTVVRDISDEKRLEEQKRRFIATAAHELRTPIANLKTRIFLMQRVPEKFMEHIVVCESVINLMQNLVEEMFDLGRFERGVIKLEREEVILQELLKEIIQYQQPEAERQDITLSFRAPETPIRLYADPYRLTQVIINLIGNAIHHTDGSGTVHVEIAHTETEILLKVIDNGVGISAEHLKYLFEPFYRVTHDKKGAGLGLAIVHEIVALHDGKISVESDVGKGSTFSVQLPLNKLSRPSNEDCSLTI